jgi:HlyD family secretion protein
MSHSGGPAPLAPTQTISVGTVAMGAMERDLVVNGSLAAWDELPVGTEAGGLAIVEIAAEEGDAVKKGQLLARLDDSVLRAELAQADASIAQAEAGLRKAEATAASAQSDAGRAKALIKNGFISGQVAEQRETTLATARADVNVARQNLEAAKALRDERAAQLAQTEIRAPTDGIVSARAATLGNVVPVGEQLFRMIRDSRVELRAEIPEMEFAALRQGQTATITLDGSGESFQGAIRLIGATVDPRTRIGLVYIALPVDAALKPGMFVHGLLRTGADHRARLRMVETGGRADGRIEITSGVAAGEQVALAGAGYLKDNDLVRVEPAIKSAAAGTVQ